MAEPSKSQLETSTHTISLLFLCLSFCLSSVIYAALVWYFGSFLERLPQLPDLLQNQ